VQPFPRQRSTR
jgi:hypothetical protein